MQAQLQKRRIVFQARWKVCTVCTLPEENLLSGPLCMLNEEHFPLTIVSARRTNGKSRYERVARLDDPHSRMTCRCCREHSLLFSCRRLAANRDATDAWAYAYHAYTYAYDVFAETSL